MSKRALPLLAQIAGDKRSLFSLAQFAVLGIIPGLSPTVKLTTKIAKLSFTATQLQKKFKNAKSFGVSTNWNKQAGTAFETALRKHCDDPGTVVIEGFYRSDPVLHYCNPLTNNNVMVDRQGNFISGWMLEPDQISNLLARGQL